MNPSSEHVAVYTRRPSERAPNLTAAGLGVVALGWFSAVLAACADVPHCKRGEVGCAGGPTDAAGLCRFGLVPSAGLCTAPADSSSAGDASGVPPQTNPCGTCPEGKTCATDEKACVDFCAAEEPIPGSLSAPEPIRCGGELRDAATGALYTLSFDETCISECRLSCRQRDWFCRTPCDKDACNEPAVLTACHARCDGEGDALSCMQSACSDTRAGGCNPKAVVCGHDELAECTGVLCSNTCASTAYDGVCDDGDLYNAAFASCAWGTDCADCGPRQGADASRKRKQGQACSLQGQCAGSMLDFAHNESFCAEVNPGLGVRRCVLDCSGEGESCPVGTTCSTLRRAASGTAPAAPITDLNKRQARACLPVACL